ncbi:MIP/aquaporin family protein [Buchnera aphidicola]|uniref:MIP/aquaporin family protein n=1 Tax=Buchnera aphidicola TaxID=9 RepID=UPI003BEF3C0C
MKIYDKNNIVQQCIAEFLGTGLIMFFGFGATISSCLTNSNLNYWDVSCIWGIGVSLSIYLSSSISGAHLNPAITLFLWLSSKFNKKKVLPYIFSQISGSFFFTMLIYYFYYKMFISFNNIHPIIPILKKNINIISVFIPSFHKNTFFLYNFSLEIITSSIFMIFLMTLNNKKKYFLYYELISPLLIGILILAINISVGFSHNITLNPARDIGPKLFLIFIGISNLVCLKDINNILFFLIPTIGSIIGINLGGWLYNTFIIENKKSNI